MCPPCFHFQAQPRDTWGSWMYWYKICHDFHFASISCLVKVLSTHTGNWCDTLTGSSKLSNQHILPLLLHDIPAQKTWADPEPVVGELMGLCISVQFISCVISEWLQKPICENWCVLNYMTQKILFQDDQLFTTTTTDYFIRFIHSPKMTNFTSNRTTDVVSLRQVLFHLRVAFTQDDTEKGCTEGVLCSWRWHHHRPYLAPVLQSFRPRHPKWQ